MPFWGFVTPPPPLTEEALAGLPAEEAIGWRRVRASVAWGKGWTEVCLER
jgi:hypothetical protein